MGYTLLEEIEVALRTAVKEGKVELIDTLSQAYQRIAFAQLEEK